MANARYADIEMTKPIQIVVINESARDGAIYGVNSSLLICHPRSYTIPATGAAEMQTSRVTDCVFYVAFFNPSTAVPLFVRQVSRMICLLKILTDVSHQRYSITSQWILFSRNLTTALLVYFYFFISLKPFTSLFVVFLIIKNSKSFWCRITKFGQISVTKDM